MKFSENWLRQWVSPDVSSEQLGHQLTMAGLELDGLEAAAPSLQGVIVAKIESTAPHPDADKLQVCQVNVGGGEKRQIVCGAKNARAGLTVALATVGSMLPGGVKIKAAKLRGIESLGMLCASSELGLDEESDGILELGDELTEGSSLTDALDLNDVVFDIDLTPNRSDCLSIEGIARETSALYQLPINATKISSVRQDSNDQFPVDVENPEICPRYCGRLLRNVNASANTPIWMKERLRRGGIRCINIIVDIGNYVMLELGQPMHAFDLDKLSEKIIVRRASNGEKLVLLDGKEIALKKDNLVIADTKRALALAGVMGGSDSAVGLETNNIFLECAYFDPIAIAGKARDFGLHTESSHRFERGVDPELALRAIERASELIKTHAGTAIIAGPVNEIFSQQHLPVRKEICLSIPKVAKILGIDIDAHEVTSILQALHFTVTSKDDSQVLVTAPSYRFDIEFDVDLIEEIARLKGYDQFPTQTLSSNLTFSASKKKSDAIFSIQENFSALGYNEAVTFSFTEQKHCLLFFDGKPKQLANPISTGLSNMRTSVWPGLCEAASYNLKRQQTTTKLFEVGRKYLVSENRLEQTEVIAGVAVGETNPRQWGVATRSIDFYDVKGDLEQLFEKMGLLEKVSYKAHCQKGLHSGKTAQILVDNQPIGVIGSLHPNVLKPLGLAKREVVVFEMNMNERLLYAPIETFQAWSKFPQVRRDLSFTVAAETAAQHLLDEIYALQISELQDIVIFSVYQGEGVPSGAKSVSLGLILQDFSSTLTEQKIEQTMTDIISLLAGKFNAELRNT
ncbi:MAG: phenylalanine--tRNA ligase subunit beta [Gammaproteobacteria bacterium]|nr:phenylalanine--tRNA ligase subunit beta [Gammaproteobacteria bacterium]